MIVSFIPGRVRLRLPELKNQSLAGELLPKIQEIPGVKAVEIKTLTGSLLIEYDPALISTERLLELGRDLARQVGISE
ncbi:MAG: heavy-metal-associated domain-containing protein [Treponema sp.]|jgi:hypothetical protein|nr:heavy-metal-associated domain-containing protein [Treponema sp.]